MSTTHSARVVLDIEMRELISAGVKAGVNKMSASRSF